jgi:competence protein ComEA
MQQRTSLRSLSLWLGCILFATALAPNILIAAGTKGVVDINSADTKTLQTLPGINHTLATRIVKGRPYKNIGDLKKVDGLTSSKLNALKGQITFGPGTNAQKSKTKKKKPTEADVGSTETPPPANEESSTVAKHPASQTTQMSHTPTTSSKELTPTGSSSGRLAPGQTVNINKASLEELDALPGIGPTKAQAIIDYRNEHGGFNSIEDIQKVKGIKEGEFSKIQDLIRVR